MKQFFYMLIFFSVVCNAAAAEQFPTVVEAEVRAVLSAEREGVLSSLKTNVGERVKKGETLATVYHRDIVYERQQLEARKKYLGVQVENLGKLNEKGLVPDEELEKAKMEKAVNNAQLKVMDTQIARSRIRSPFSGIVVARHVQPHEWVRPGQPVLELYDPGHLRVVADIPAEIAVKLKIGQEDMLFFSDIGKEVSAKLKLVFPQVDVRSNTRKVHWSVDSRKSGLLPGMKGVFHWN
jgi:membrane fusion protein (multidrug efflux system)